MGSPSEESDDEAAHSLRGRATYEPSEQDGVGSRLIGWGIHQDEALISPSTFNMGSPHMNPVFGEEAYTMICPVLLQLRSVNRVMSPYAGVYDPAIPTYTR